jgi:hypothetical protein
MDFFLGVCSWRFPVVKVLRCVFLLCGSGYEVQARRQNGLLPGLGEMYTVCTGQSPPFVSCSLNDSSVTPTGDWRSSLFMEYVHHIPYCVQLVLVFAHLYKLYMSWAASVVIVGVMVVAL